MKKLNYLTLLLFSQIVLCQVGIGTTTPKNTIDVNGWIKIGNENVTPTPSNEEGSLRYNSAKKCMELHNGTTWQCIGQPKIQIHTINDGVNETMRGSGFTNYNNWQTNGYGTTGIKTITVSDVAPNSKILYLIEVAIGDNKKLVNLHNNTLKIYGNGIFQEFDVPSSTSESVFTTFMCGTPNNTTTGNLTFNFECNNEFTNLKISTIVF